jgi:hypothetical protein
MRGSARTLFVHLGLPKTASTWLQTDVFPRLDHLTVRVVPTTKLFSDDEALASGSRTFAAAMGRSAEVWRQRGDAILEELLGPREEWLASGGDLLVSDEAIGRKASRPEQLAAHLSAFFEAARGWGFGRMRLLALVRRQDTWLASHYAQMSSRHLWARQADFRRRTLRHVDPARGRYGFGMLLDYAALHEALIRAAPSEDVLFLPHETLSTQRDEGLSRILAWLGTPEEAAVRIGTLAQGRANVRSRTVRGQPAWLLRPPSLRLPGAGRRLSVPPAAWPRRRIELPLALSERIIAAYADRNELFARRTGLALEEHGYF